MEGGASFLQRLSESEATVLDIPQDVAPFSCQTWVKGPFVSYSQARGVE